MNHKGHKEHKGQIEQKMPASDTGRLKTALLEKASGEKRI